MKKFYELEGGSSSGLKRGPLLEENQPYYMHSGQAYMVVDSTEIYFMTGERKSYSWLYNYNHMHETVYTLHKINISKRCK